MTASGNIRRQKRKHPGRPNALPGWHTKSEWNALKKAYGNACAICGRKPPEIKLTKDHIIPVSRPDLGATNYIWNIQPLCQDCNTHKSNQILVGAISYNHYAIMKEQYH